MLDTKAESADPEPTPPAQLDGSLSRFVKGFRIRKAHRELRAARSILDLGCGYAELAETIGPGVDYVGVDRSPWLLERARRRFPQYRFEEGDLEDRSFDPSGAFERLVLLAVWEHLHDPLDFLTRARRWALPGGRVVLTTPAPHARALLERGARWGLLSGHADDEHERLWSTEELRRAGSEAGWEFIRSETFLFGLNQLVVFERPLV